MPLSEALLPARVADCAQLDARAFYAEHAPFVHGVLSRMLGPGADADDLTHDVFLIALRRPDRLQQDARSWVFGIALKLASRARSQARLRRMLGMEAAADIPDPNTPEQIFESAEDSRLVYALLDRMAEKKRTVFVLDQLQGFSGAEIAAALKCPLKTVWTRLYHARREFLALYERALRRAAAEER